MIGFWRKYLSMKGLWLTMQFAIQRPMTSTCVLMLYLSWVSKSLLWLCFDDELLSSFCYSGNNTTHTLPCSGWWYWIFSRSHARAGPVSSMTNTMVFQAQCLQYCLGFARICTVLCSSVESYSWVIHLEKLNSGDFLVL